MLLSICFIAMSGVQPNPLLRYLVDGIYPQQTASIESFAQYALWLFIISHIFLIGFASGFLQMFASHHWTITLSIRMMYTGLIIFILVTLFTIGITKGLAKVVYSTTEITDTMRGTAQTFIAFRNYAGVLAGVLIALSCFGLGFVFRNSSQMISIWVSSAGFLSIVGAFWPLWLDLSYLRNAGYLLLLSWIAVISIIILWKHQRLTEKA
jgi:hypothetical protein